MKIYRVTENKGYNSIEKFFEKEEDARRWMKNNANSYLYKPVIGDNLFVDVDLPRHLHLRFGDPDGDNGLFMMLDMDEIIVH